MEQKSKHSDISLKLKEIFKTLFDKDIDKVSNDPYKEELLGLKIGLAPYHLLYLFFEVEKTFGIAISEEDIASYKFNSFNDILDIICQELNIKQDSVA